MHIMFNHDCSVINYFVYTKVLHLIRKISPVFFLTLVVSKVTEKDCQNMLKIKKNSVFTKFKVSFFQIILKDRFQK